MNDIALIQIEDEFPLDHTRKIIELGTHDIPDKAEITVSGLFELFLNCNII
jgi:hypothetical protein